MKFPKFNVLTVSVSAFTLAMAMSCCDSENSITATASSPTATTQNTPPITPPDIKRAEDGKTFVRLDGWPIPSFDESKREEFETSIPSSDGRSVKVHRTVIDPSSLLFTGNPLHLIGMRSKDILIHKVQEYRTSAGIFCYSFQVNDAGVDESTDKLRPTRSLLYSYKYYDEDADGVFESLVLDEKDRFGHTGFEGEPHLPKWASDKDQ